jgi:hypothetical protein
VLDGDYFFSKFIRMCNQPEGFYKVLIRKGFNDNVIGNPRNGNWEMKND